MKQEELRMYEHRSSVALDCEVQPCLGEAESFELLQLLNEVFHKHKLGEHKHQ